VQDELHFSFPYMSINDVMKLTKQPGITTLEQIFDNSCSMRVTVRRDDAERLRSKLLDVDGLTMID
jgi:putative IMPACT (imprinted ancient) family translation regulator